MNSKIVQYRIHLHMWCMIYSLNVSQLILLWFIEVHAVLLVILMPNSEYLSK